MVLADLTWQLDNGPILNTDSSGPPFTDIEQVTGFDSTPFRETIREHEGVDGGFMDAEFETGRDVILDGTVYGDVSTVETYLDSLKQNFAPRATPVALVFKIPGVYERVIFVKPRGCRYRWDQGRRIGIIPVQFLMYAEDPRFYDNTLQGASAPFGGPATTGFAFSFGFNLSFGVVVPVSGADVTVGGNRPTPAVITIPGPAVNPRIINVTDGLSLDFVVTLGASDILTIDLGNRTVTLNGNINLRNTLQRPDWWLFNPGVTNIVYGGGSSSGGPAVISFRNAWR
jgi:hypothetical protein